MSTHEAIISPDSRGRFGLIKWLGKLGRFKVFVEREGVVRLERVDD